jgi:rhodanese-related sulfurtransferase
VSTSSPLPETFATAHKHAAGYHELPITDLALPVSGGQLIDVREPDEFVGELGHLAGARLVPVASCADAMATWSLDDTYLLICRSGGRSGSVAQAMVRAGFTRVVNLTGGMLAWNAAGKPVER